MPIPSFRLSMLLVPLLLCQCKSDHKVVDGNAEKSALNSDSDMLKKFAGWKPEEASWWADTGETDKKKSKENEKDRRRTVFEKRVTDSRQDALFGKDDSWANRQFRSGEFAGQKEKKTFRWPWEKKTAKTQEVKFPQASRDQGKLARDASKSARESGDTSREAGDRYATSNFAASDKAARTFSNVPADNAFKHDDPKIIREAGSDNPDNSNGNLTVSDIRKLLNKQ